MKKIYGVAYNNGEYKVRGCKIYTLWRNMLKRCLSDEYKLRNPSYAECAVCNSWLDFSTFKKWVLTQDYENKSLDKDLLIRGNKIYSPDTCIFISKKINSFIIESDAIRGQYPIGVCFRKDLKLFQAQIREGTRMRKHLGFFHTPEEAHQAWLKAKLELAKKLAAEQDDPRVAKALVERYENYDYL